VVFRKISDSKKQELLKEQRFGNYFHALMAICNAESTLEPSLATLIQNGEIDPVYQPELLEKAKNFFGQTTSLFADTEEIINEQLILMPGDFTDKRPDKILLKKDELIVFDFKTGKQSDRHQPQLIGYQTALSEIFDKPIKLYLYYTETNSLLRI
jgi:ATP-dependent exoDNAse (exonuclease V) beta subunit